MKPPERGSALMDSAMVLGALGMLLPVVMMLRALKLMVPPPIESEVDIVD